MGFILEKKVSQRVQCLPYVSQVFWDNAEFSMLFSIGPQEICVLDG